MLPICVHHIQEVLLQDDENKKRDVILAFTKANHI